MTEVRSFVEIDVPLPSSSTVGSIPNVTSINTTPILIDPGVSIGQRGSVSVSFRDVQYPLAGTSFFSGSFWGKMRALRRSLQGLPLRIIRQAGDQEIVEHYTIETLSRSGGDQVTITAKDLYKVADADRAQAPILSRGRVLLGFDEVATTFTLTPVGIGSLEYPVEGKVAIGGSEVCSFTRAGDDMTIVRAQSGTVAKAHDADEIVQLVLIYDALSPAVIFYSLLATYTDISSDWLPLEEWQADIDSYVGRLYSAEIAVPTSVKVLLDELIEQTGLVTWWDLIGHAVRLKSLRPVTGARVVSTDEMMADSFSFQEQPNKRVSEVWTHFALRNPLAKLDDPANYRSTLLTTDPNADQEYSGQPAIRKIFSRWIAINNRPAASRINSLQLSRYRDPPRKFSFDLFITSESPILGQGLELEHWSLQDEDGNTVTAPVQVTSIERNEDRLVIDAEEMLFTSVIDPDFADGGVRLIVIDSDSYNLNLRDLHDSFYVTAVSGDEVLCIIEANFKVGSMQTGLPAFDVGTWAAGVVITLRILGRIQGAGGQGGYGGMVSSIFPENSYIAETGEAGGTALYTATAVTVDNQGAIYGGGGGGGGGGQFETPAPGGSGGSGFNPGAGGGGGSGPGTTEAGGPAEPLGGVGGGPGQPGGNGSGSNSAGGGAAGAAVDGDSLITYTTVGTIAGAQIN